MKLESQMPMMTNIVADIEDVFDIQIQTRTHQKFHFSTNSIILLNWDIFGAYDRIISFLTT